MNTVTAEEILRKSIAHEVGANCTDQDWEEMKSSEKVCIATLKAMEEYATSREAKSTKREDVEELVEILKECLGSNAALGGIHETVALNAKRLIEKHSLPLK